MIKLIDEVIKALILKCSCLNKVSSTSNTNFLIFCYSPKIPNTQIALKYLLNLFYFPLIRSTSAKLKSPSSQPYHLSPHSQEKAMVTVNKFLVQTHCSRPSFSNKRSDYMVSKDEFHFALKPKMDQEKRKLFSSFVLFFIFAYIDFPFSVSGRKEWEWCKTEECLGDTEEISFVSWEKRNWLLRSNQ